MTVWFCPGVAWPWMYLQCTSSAATRKELRGVGKRFVFLQIRQLGFWGRIRLTCVSYEPLAIMRNCVEWCLCFLMVCFFWGGCFCLARTPRPKVPLVLHSLRWNLPKVPQHSCVHHISSIPAQILTWKRWVEPCWTSPSIWICMYWPPSYKQCEIMLTYIRSEATGTYWIVIFTHLQSYCKAVGQVTFPAGAHRELCRSSR